MIEFIVLMILLLILLYIFVVFIIYEVKYSAIPIGYDFYHRSKNTYTYKSLNNLDLSKYINLHSHNEKGDYYVYLQKLPVDLYLSIDYFVVMSEENNLIISTSGVYQDNNFIPDLIISKNQYYNIPDIKGILQTNSYYVKMLEYGLPVNIDNLTLVNGYCLYEEVDFNFIKKTKEILYPLSKHINAIVPKYRPAKINRVGGKIPKKIFQTYETMVVPYIITDCINSWLEYNPEYEYNYYTGNECRNFIRDNFEPEVLQAYDDLYPGAYKSDLWRCCVLYKYGGVYADIKLYPLDKIDRFINNDTDLFLVYDLEQNVFSSGKAIYNAFMACRPNHPIIKILIDEIVKNVKNRFYGGNCLDITGPTFIYRILVNLKLDLNRNISVINHQEYGKIQLGQLNINNAIMDSVIELDNKKIISRRNPKYRGIIYDKLMLRTGGKEHYSCLYKNKQVYN